MARLYESHKRIVVTGGAGFICSHLIDQLLRHGHEVLCLDNLFTGTRRNIEPRFGEPAFEVMHHDVTFPLYIGVDEIERELAASSQRGFDIGEMRLREGTIDLVTPLITQHALFTAQDNLIIARLARLNDVLNLFQALGRGWLPPPPKGHAAQVQ